MIRRSRGTNWCKGGGFTLIELIAALAILGIMTTLASALFTFAIDASNKAKAIADIATIGQQAVKFEVENGRHPESLAEIGFGDLEDPWGNRYQYLKIYGEGNRIRGSARKDRNLVPINTLFDIYSKGKDGDSRRPLTVPVSHDDIIWANDGSFIGLAEDF